MPNPRRRKFSVNNDLAGKSTSKNAATGPASLKSSVRKYNSNLKEKFGATSNRMFPQSTESSSIDLLESIASSTSMLTVKRKCVTLDKDVTANASNIDLFNFMQITEDVIESKLTPEAARAAKHLNRERAELRREKPRQHKAKVRSPRRRTLPEIFRVEFVRTSTGCDPVEWALEMEAPNVTAPPAPATLDERPSEHSLDSMCRICHGGESLSMELGPLISACNCRGTVGRVHVRCLERWLTESGKTRCELCGARYATRRVHRYGVPRALLMWVLSQNAKQLMVDSLGIMLMSPLAVLAAWLSGRTLAGLMMQEGHMTPWPLASTFVLACMTLVCYYCWIVSAATRHALGWWIWYRSQYEVRLLLQDTEDS